MLDEPVHPAPAPGQAAELRRGLGLAVVAALCFGLSGAVARGLIDSGWTAGAAVLARIGLASAVLVGPGLAALRGRWSLLRDHAPRLLLYGVLAVALTQLGYFYAVTYLPVGVALLVEYTAPVAVVGWMWAVHGQRPGRPMVLGGVVAVGGLVLLLDVGGGGGLPVVGVLWALAAMSGAAAYFVLSADPSIGLPPLTLAAAGLGTGTIVLALAGLAGFLPMSAGTTDVTYAVGTVPWWVPVAVLGLVTAALAYVVGIAAGRRLGPRLASFAALGEVVAAVVFALVLLDQVPDVVQLVGAVLVLTGVAVVRAGERVPRAGLRTPRPGAARRGGRPTPRG